MVDIQPYLKTKQDEVAIIVESIDKIALADDAGCADLIDTRIMLADTEAKIDAAVLLHNQPLQAQIDEVNKEAQTIKRMLADCSEGAKAEIYRYMQGTGAQRIHSGVQTAFFRENKDKVTVTVEDESVIPDMFFKRTPDLTKIKNHYLKTGRVLLGVKIDTEPQDDTLIFKAVK